MYKYWVGHERFSLLQKHSCLKIILRRSKFSNKTVTFTECLVHWQKAPVETMHLKP